MNAAEQRLWETKRYGQWAGNERGRGYAPGFCAEEVPAGFLFKQCTRKSGHGPDALYCRQHAKRYTGTETPNE